MVTRDANSDLTASLLSEDRAAHRNLVFSPSSPSPADEAGNETPINMRPGRRGVPRLPGDRGNTRLLRQSQRRFVVATADATETIHSIERLIEELQEAQVAALELMSHASRGLEPLGAVAFAPLISQSPASSPGINAAGTDAAAFRVETLSHRIDAMCKALHTDVHEAMTNPDTSDPHLRKHRQSNITKEGKFPEDVKIPSVTVTGAAPNEHVRHTKGAGQLGQPKTVVSMDYLDRRPGGSGCIPGSVSAQEITTRRGLRPDHDNRYHAARSYREASSLSASLVSDGYHGQSSLSNAYTRRLSQSSVSYHMYGAVTGSTVGPGALGSCRARIPKEQCPAIERELAQCVAMFSEAWVSYYCSACERLGTNAMFAPDSPGESDDGDNAFTDHVTTDDEDGQKAGAAVLSCSSVSEASVRCTRMAGRNGVMNPSVSTGLETSVMDDTLSSVQFQLGHIRRLLLSIAASGSSPGGKCSVKGKGFSNRGGETKVVIPNGNRVVVPVLENTASSLGSVKAGRLSKSQQCCLAFLLAFVFVAVIGAAVAVAIIHAYCPKEEGCF